MNGLMTAQRISLTLTAVRKFGIDWREISLLFKLIIASISASQCLQKFSRLGWSKSRHDGPDSSSVRVISKSCNL